MCDGLPLAAIAIAPALAAIFRRSSTQSGRWKESTAHQGDCGFHWLHFACQGAGGAPS